jgi:hypothetical protein
VEAQGNNEADTGKTTIDPTDAKEDAEAQTQPNLSQEDAEGTNQNDETMV